jgi:tetratricopeptide (TPR) repeat protein
MKKSFAIVVLLFIVTHLMGQTNSDKEGKLVFDKEKTSNPYKRFSICVSLVKLYGVKGQLDSIPKYTSELFEIAQKQENDSLLMAAYIAVARYYDYKTDTRAELEYLFKALKIAEKKHPDALRSIYVGLGGAYLDIPNNLAAIKYFKSALKLTPENSEAILFAELNFQFSKAYLSMNKLDSALYYINQTNDYLIKTNATENKAYVYAVTGNIYAKIGNDSLARNYYERSVNPVINQRKTYDDAVALSLYSNYLINDGNLKQAKSLGLEGLIAAKRSQSKKPFLTLVENLRKTYEAQNQNDSAYYFAKLELVYRDSLYNQGKLSAVQDMTINEDIRQREEAIKLNEAATEHRHNLQYAAIAIAIIVFIIIIVLFSRTILVSEKAIEFMGVLGLLTAFEFINLLIHPYLGELTHHSPVLMLVTLVIIAALLVPLHHRIEHWMTDIMLEKNRKAKLNALKKVSKPDEEANDQFD